MSANATAEPAPAPPALGALHRRLAMALGPHIGVVCAGVDGDPERLWPIEWDAVRNAIPRRRREFAAGRTAAREAMTLVGLTPAAIPCAADRSPIWPDDVVGSITHTANVCVAVAGRRHQVHALGIDIEEDRPMDRTLWPIICTPEELAVLTTQPLSERGRWVTRLFCAKEAFYKWQYPQTGRMLEFSDVQVAFSADQHSFRAWLCTHRKSGHTNNASASAAPSSRDGRLLSTHGVVIAWLSGISSLV